MADREKLIELIRSGVACPIDRDPFGESCKGCPYEDVTDCDFARLADALIANGVTVRERGRWLYDSGSGKYFCSACDEEALSFKKDTLGYGELYEVCLTDFCPNCGADMRGEEDA